MSLPGLFVTGTGTDVGKTYVTAGLIRALVQAGQAVEPLKPVLSGFDPEAAAAVLAASDPALLLDAAGLAWTEVFLGGGSSVVTAAVSAGLAISAFSHRLAPAGTVEVSQRFGLPALPSSEIVLHSTLSDAKSREALRTLAMAFREHRPPATANAARPRFRNSQMNDSLA